MQEELVTIQKDKNGKFDVLFCGSPMETHDNDYFPPLEEDIATLLADDVNFAINNIDNPGNRDSFVFCVLSTLHHTKKGSVCGDHNCKMNRYELPVDITTLIQWDHCFRISPNPKFALTQRRANYPVVDFLDGDWVDLPVNPIYPDEETDDKSADWGRIPQRIIEKFTDILNGFSRAQRFAVTLFSDMFNDFSVSLTTLLIAKLVSPEDYFMASLIFRYNKTNDRLTKKEKLELDDFIPRINNLLKALDSEGIKALI